MRTHTAILAAMTLLACGDKDDDDTADDTGLYGTDGADGGDGADGTDGSDGTSDGSDGTSTGTLPDCEAADGFATDLDGLAVSGDTLSATLAYSGGCEEHVFTLCWPEPAFMESEPVQAALEIHHGGTPDPCEAYPTEVVDFDLTPLKEAWQDSYGATSGTIILNVRTRGGADSVEYSF